MTSQKYLAYPVSVCIDYAGILIFQLFWLIGSFMLRNCYVCMIVCEASYMQCISYRAAMLVQTQTPHLIHPLVMVHHFPLESNSTQQKG